jgi:hypothetical protein
VSSGIEVYKASMFIHVLQMQVWVGIRNLGPSARCGMQNDACFGRLGPRMNILVFVLNLRNCI